MKRYLIGMVLAVTLGGAVVSCSDDMPAESYYTFKGEMLSDYLRNRPEFSDFAAIVERAGKMDLLSTYGRYTCFAPTNDAVQAYFRQNGISGIDALSNEDCDTLASTAIVEDIYGTSELAGANFLSKANMLGRNLSVESQPVIEDGDTVNTTYLINRTGRLIIELANDSVENGIVHPVEALVVASNLTLPTIMKEDPNIGIFNLCIEMTELDKKMMRIKDASYDPEYWRRGPLPEGTRQSGAPTQFDYCHVPETRNYGYTAFAVPDSILKAEYNINTWEDLYDYACTIYTDGAGEAYYDKQHLTDERNPLYRLIAYHLLDRKGLYDKLYTYCSIYTGDIFPTEWYRTMAPLSTIKVEMVNGKFAANNTFKGSAELGNMYLNRHYDPNNPATEQRGAIVSPHVAEGLTQLAVNGVYYYIDRIVDFGEKSQQTVFNTRMRMDLYTLWPEVMNNDIRSDKTYGDINDVSDPNAPAPNYIFPYNYFEDITLDPDGEFLYQGCRHSFWSYEGDEFNLRSNNNTFDMTFKLPSVPDGDYQIRLGFAPMDYRAVAQMYFDGIPQGIPLDMRAEGTGLRDRIGWQDFDESAWRNNTEAWELNKKDLHNQGWYHGPGGVRNGSGFQNDWDLATSNSSSFIRNDCHTMRRVIYQGHISSDRVHTIRMRSTYAVGFAQLMIDYLELVPKSVYGVEGEGRGEDDF